ncbi:molecular chaperone DnaJ [Marinobacter salinisoli]|uniref:Molecular chaperone DnaJ n=2 Tax=Marinobacter salinisoli TaxID=2769486 RepID=A0ABX7MVX2_9GAMM|nr:molecular chaperone DnaJ [Marinobacter salinisoli]
MNEPCQLTTCRATRTSAQHHALEQQIQHLMVAVEHELRQAPEGLSELYLLKALQAEPWKLFGEISFSEPEKLYPVHFLLFHVLYRLRDTLSGAGLALEISPLTIRLELCPVVSSTGLPQGNDKLRAFYLDLSHYQLDDAVILQMMDNFWAGQSGTAPAEADVREASELLGFDSIPQTFAEVKQRFRRAVMQAHPDRGGDTGEIQRLNQAFAVFKNHFKLAN